MTDTSTQVKAAILDWLLANCIEEDEGGWMRLCFSTARQLSDHPDKQHWMLSDLSGEAGVDLDAALAAPQPESQPLDYCTDSDNCKRCKTHSALRGNMYHAGIGKYPWDTPQPVKQDAP